MPPSPPPPALNFPATRRNREPIRAALESVLPESGIVLEIASGSGEHTAYFAPFFGGLTWQPSDPEAAHRDSIAAHAAATGAANIRPPLTLDVTMRPWPVRSADAILAINLIHIARWDVSLALLDGAAGCLSPGAPLFLYGPFMRDGAHTAPSNDAFDRGLRAQNPAWGVRDLTAVTAAAEESGLALDRAIEMPANNLGVVFRKPA